LNNSDSATNELPETANIESPLGDVGNCAEQGPALAEEKVELSLSTLDLLKGMFRLHTGIIKLDWAHAAEARRKHRKIPEEVDEAMKAVCAAANSIFLLIGDSLPGCLPERPGPEKPGSKVNPHPKRWLALNAVMDGIGWRLRCG
jgi:hypothetical protein